MSLESNKIEFIYTDYCDCFVLIVMVSIRKLATIKFRANKKRLLTIETNNLVLFF